MVKTILIVDDNAIERTLLAQYLKAEYNILEASSGEKAIDLLSTADGKISAVILDLLMPGIDGFETLKRIRANSKLQSIPIIITTELKDEDSREKAIINGADSFITKPCNRALLLHILQNVIRLRETVAIANSLWRDNLTGLLNRESFFSEAQRMIKRHEPGYYILSSFDIEHFKVVNDQYGTEIGDKVLVYIANCLSGFIADINGLICRYTADKFVILFPANVKDSERVAAVHKAATQPDCIGRALRVRIGRYTVTDLSLPVSAMFDRACMAEETLKGRYDSYIADYDDSMRERILKEQQIVNSMDSAIKNGEFEPWLQPQYNHATGAMIGAEALVRWKKDGKYISPAEFVPVFERNGFVYEMDQYIWERVCFLLRRWLDEGKNPLPVSVNISRRDLRHTHFIDVITGIVNKYRLPYDLLRLEVTESAFAESSIIEKVDALIELGFTVEIDDFGSGYSSLNTLKDVPASILKLDMKFFEDTKNTQRGGNIIESVVRMAKWLGMSVIAEGVEEKAQADYLKSIGCYYIQGYFYAKPMPVEEYEKLFGGEQKEQKLSVLQTLNALDNNEFWNPKSIETLIFNSYVGGACIFEYHNGDSELLRMNEQYTLEMRGLIPPGTQLSDASMVQFMTVEERDKLRGIIKQAIATNKEAACELCISNGKQTEYIRITNRVIARAGERCLLYGVVLNVTERVEAEKKKNESAEMLKVIMSNISGGVSAVVVDDDGNFKFVFNNEKYYALYGYTQEQAQRENVNPMSRIIPTDFSKVLEKIKQLKKDRKPVPIDYQIIKPDGRFALLRAQASLMHIDGYGDDVIASVVTDITEKRLFEDQLRAIVENIYGGISATVIRNGKPQILMINDRFFEIHGFDSREEYFQEDYGYYTGIHPDDKDMVRQSFESSDKERYTLEYRIIRKSDGVVRYVRNNIRVIMLFGVDEPVRLSVISDVTAEKKTDFELKTLLRVIPSGVLKYSADEKEEFEYINSNFVEGLGYTMEQFRKKFNNCFREMVYEQDRERAAHEILVQEGNGGIGKFDYRIEAADGSLRWFHDEGVKITDEDGKKWYYVTLVDVTEQKTAERSLRQAEEEYRIATRHSGHTIGRYNIAEQTLSITEDAEERLELPELIKDVPYGRVKQGKISPETSDSYIQFYEDIMRGRREGTVTFRKLLSTGWRWITERSTTIFDSSNRPVSAIISYVDVTEHQEKEIAYKKWKQELMSKRPEAFILYRCNLNKTSAYDSVEGKLITFITDRFSDETFNERTRDFAEQCIVREDRQRYVSYVNADSMLANYFRGKRSGSIEFRAKISTGETHWVRLTVDLVQYPNSSDIEAFLMYDDINDSKIRELTTKAQAETDPLTGLLNRKAFAAKLDEILTRKSEGRLSALFLIDMDGFKLVNDSLGHLAGDQVLIDTGKAISSAARNGDLVCRLGGDEFLVCIRNMTDFDSIRKKAEQVCRFAHRSVGAGLKVTISLGISVFPDDGSSFDELYRKADKALYQAKGNGKDNYAFFAEKMSSEEK